MKSSRFLRGGTFTSLRRVRSADRNRRSPSARSSSSVSAPPGLTPELLYTFTPSAFQLRLLYMRILKYFENLHGFACSYPNKQVRLPFGSPIESEPDAEMRSDAWRRVAKR